MADVDVESGPLERVGHLVDYSLPGSLDSEISVYFGDIVGVGPPSVHSGKLADPRQIGANGGDVVLTSLSAGALNIGANHIGQALQTQFLDLVFKC